MKLLILIFLISLSYVLSDIIDGNDKKIVVKKFPKKVKHNGPLQINSSGRSIKQKKIAKNGYTLFPKINDGRPNVPDSPYFQEDKNIEVKPRTKKVLAPRSKRALSRGGDKNKPAPYHPPKPINKPPKPVVKPDKIKPGGNNIKRPGRTGRLRNGPNRYRNLKNPRTQRLRTKLDRSARMNRKNEKSLAKKVGRRLIAARDAMIEDYPYVVSIQKGKEHWCAGALLNPRLVITTANCLWKGNRVSRMSVRAGSRHTDRGGQVAYIREIMKHPGWKIRKAPDNDIAMVLLDRNIQFSNVLHSVDLPNRVMMPAFEDAWVTSWGSERRDGLFEVKSDTLQVYHSRVIDRQKCNNVTSRFGVRVTENFICLAQTGRRAPCTRDTGAPAVSDGVLWGLASWGIRKLCGTERFPAMFSYLASQTNLNFIINATLYLMSDEVHYPYLDRIQIQKRAKAT